ncbi:7444_t:CDS:1, partial [Gigaspora rosea]
KCLKYCGISVKMNGSEDDLVFNYEILDENSADTNKEEVLNFDNNNDEYEGIRVDND